LTRLEDLLSAEESDLNSIEQINGKAVEILSAAREEAKRRKIDLGGDDAAAAVA
jgi:hypothetical protein